ncbi:MAG: 16S rRNA (cytidine(1402)-2'-O)-methyltransferase [Limnobacter sp.]|nr:16S rRNA (cytidine(1402)-2'-O)-methyltransferase [Limnobacter sp.]
MSSGSIKQFGSSSSASLYVVSTPIGNLGDLSIRARQVLESVDRIAAEDTRNTARLLEQLGIKKPLLAHHAHKEGASAEGLVKVLESGQSVALVTDAGTPAVSDPGSRVVDLVAGRGFPVVPIPGASSVLTIVAASGLVQGPFTFRGFLPTKTGARRESLLNWLEQPEPQVLFEAPHRIVQLATELNELCIPERRLCAGREMTKQHETFYRGSAADLLQSVQTDPYAERGEWALVIDGKQVKSASRTELAQANIDLNLLVTELLQEVSAKTTVKLVMTLTGLPKSKVYPLVMELKDQEPSS